MPVLAPGASTLRVLHISDLHMTPNQKLKQNWLRELDGLEPDLVVNTGDNLSHPKAVPAVVQALGGLLARPGLFVFGSNDYFAPVLKNPLAYFDKDHDRVYGPPLPWGDLRAAFTERGWQDMTHVRRDIEVGGVRIAVGGVDDPHLDRDRYETIAGAADPSADLRLGMTHSPEPRVLDRFAEDGYDLVLAGHTHGGQVNPVVGLWHVPLARLETPYVDGRYQLGGTTIIVTAGVGYSLVPFRYASPGSIETIDVTW